MSFYDKKLALLHSFQDDEILHAFRNQEREMGALLGDRDHEVELEPNGLSLKLFRPNGDTGRLERAAQVIIEALGPSPVTSVDVDLQYLAPLPTDYQTSLSRSALTFLGLNEEQVEGRSDQGLHAWDWAVLLDGQSDRADAQFKVEFGIVESSEIPERLARETGRIEGGNTPASSEHWEDVDFPNVALFADWSWSGKSSDDLPPLEAMMASWSYAKEDAERLLTHVVSRLEATTVSEQTE